MRAIVRRKLRKLESGIRSLRRHPTSAGLLAAGAIVLVAAGVFAGQPNQKASETPKAQAAAANDGPARQEKAVTDAEKAEFLKLLVKLPTRGEFYTVEAVRKAIPYTRVLLAISKQDLLKAYGKQDGEEYDIYPLAALSAGLNQHQEARQYAAAHFGGIADPKLKLLWASLLFDEDAHTAEILAFLQRALASNEDAQILSKMHGRGFEDFKYRVTSTWQAAEKATVELVKRHVTTAFGDHDSYNGRELRFAPGRLLYAVRPLKQRGELCAYDLNTGTTSRRAIPQPAGFKPKLDVATYFDNPVLSVNAAGDLFCCWTLGYNGDRALAQLKKGAAAFRVNRVEMYLANSFVLADRDGTWYLIRWSGSADFTVYRIDEDLNLTRLGSFAGRGHHTIEILDARFISTGVLHLFWGDVLPRANHLRMRCVDFDVNKQEWLHSREIFRLDKFVSSANEPTLLQLKDHSLHYLWGIDEGAEQGEATGLYYQAESDGHTIKVCKGQEHRAIALGDRIVVCYTIDDSPNKVFFRVIRHGVAGPVSEVTIAEGREYNLRPEYMALYSESDRIWFVNATESNVLYELRMVTLQGENR